MENYETLLSSNSVMDLSQNKGIIVIDGPDACGKTTLAETIKERCEAKGIKYNYIHASYRWPKKMFMYHEAILRRAIKLSQDGIVVIDRLHLSELVYSQVYRNGSKWPLQHRYFDRLLQKHGALTIICTGEADQVLTWHAEAKGQRHEMYDSGLDSVASKFIDLFNQRRSRLDVWLYNRADYPDVYSRRVFADRCIDRINRLRSGQIPAALSDRVYNFLGSAETAKYLFVGDELNNKGRHQIWPFWEYCYSSLYLTKALDAIRFDESEAVWMNYNFDGPDISIYDIIEYNPNLKVISLGFKQGRQIEKQGIDCALVAHPSFSMRFNMKDYEDKLRAVLDA